MYCNNSAKNDLQYEYYEHRVVTNMSNHWAAYNSLTHKHRYPSPLIQCVVYHFPPHTPSPNSFQFIFMSLSCVDTVSVISHSHTHRHRRIRWSHHFPVIFPFLIIAFIRLNFIGQQIFENLLTCSNFCCLFSVSRVPLFICSWEIQFGLIVWTSLPLERKESRVCNVLIADWMKWSGSECHTESLSFAFESFREWHTKHTAHHCQNVTCKRKYLAKLTDAKSILIRFVPFVCRRICLKIDLRE